MPTEVITALISSVIGGLLVALVNHLFTRNKTTAETEKLRAEAEKIKAEAHKLAIEAENIQRQWEEANEKFRAQFLLLQKLIDGDLIEGFELNALAKDAIRKIMEDKPTNSTKRD